MLPFGIGFSEVLLILVVVLLVVGPQKLPDIAKTLGKGVRTLRKAGQDLRDAIDVDDIKRSVFDEPPRPTWRRPSSVDDIVPDEAGVYAAAAVDGAEPAAPPVEPSVEPSASEPRTVARGTFAQGSEPPDDADEEATPAAESPAHEPRTVSLGKAPRDAAHSEAAPRSAPATAPDADEHSEEPKPPVA